jgi:hypothetical protein
MTVFALFLNLHAPLPAVRIFFTLEACREALQAALPTVPDDDQPGCVESPLRVQ